MVVESVVVRHKFGEVEGCSGSVTCSVRSRSVVVRHKFGEVEACSEFVTCSVRWSREVFRHLFGEVKKCSGPSPVWWVLECIVPSLVR